MRNLILTIVVLFVCMSVSAAARNHEVVSPDGTLKAEITIDKGAIRYSVLKDGKLMLAPSQVAMRLADGTAYDGTVRLQNVVKASVDGVLKADFYKKSQIRERYNQLTFRFKTFELVFRAYDAGVAYRFVSKSKVPFKVAGETAEFAFPADWNMYVPYVCQHTETLESQYYNSFENRYEYVALSQWNKERLAFLPLMVSVPEGYKVNIMESALIDYPGMYLYNSDGDSTLETRFAPYPKEIKQGGHNNLQGEVQSREDYIAAYDGATSFPWRIVNVSAQDREMLDNDLVWLLGEPADPQADWSWVKPGKVAWEWWNNWHVTGVDFKAGVNNDTYKYYIDFASKYGIEYVILDEGWAVNGKADLFDVVPEIDIKELCDYAAARNVGIVLWAGYWAFDKDMEKICAHYSQLGVKGWKIDFMDRDDQMMVDFYRRAAEMAAKYHQFVDFHGAYKPCGLNRTYPNVLNYEGVHGLEQMKWSKVGTDQLTYDVTFPYIRMAAGPVDYTQGAMNNQNYAWYKPNNVEPVSQGTRCHQLGMYVVFESPFNMLCDAPQYYEQNKECTEFIAKIPTVFDETVALDGKVGEYIVLARRSGDTWYVGGLAGQNARTVTVDLSFLGDGDWKMELFKDGVNARRHAEDYKKLVKAAGDTLTLEMAPGGGFAAIITAKAQDGTQEVPDYDWARFGMYSQANAAVSVKPKAVIMGDSITEGWARKDAEFFEANNFIGRGISGQTTSHMLVRFRKDVLDHAPEYVVILAGTNDIARNNGFISLENIFGNIVSMCELAEVHGIRPVICSVLPAARYGWRPALEGVAAEVIALNVMLRDYALSKGYVYVDFHSALKDENDGLPQKHAADGVHPNLECYRIMDGMLLEALR